MPIVVPSAYYLFLHKSTTFYIHGKRFSFFSNGGKTRVNSEELEQSLKAEFENHIKGLHAQTREDVSEFQSKIEAELAKHRAQLDAAFQGFVSRFDREPEFEGGFTESVIEHLRLARDEGAKITATAIAQAEELEKASEPSANLNALKEAINDISSEDSQSAILKALINHAAKYTPRGVFFIVKNAHFVGWKLFGKEAGEGDNVVRDIHFPVEADSILGAAAKKLATVDGPFGTYAEDHVFLDPLRFGKPDRMYAIPLIARGRGVAVLYADYGHEGVAVNTDALEMMVKVAGLTVELLASSKSAEPEGKQPESADFSETHFEEESPTTVEAPPANPFQDTVTESPTTSESPAPQVFSSPFPEPSVGSFAAEQPFTPQQAFTPSIPEPSTGGFEFKQNFDNGSDFSPAATEPAFEPPPSTQSTGSESSNSVPDFASASTGGDFESPPPSTNFEPIAAETAPPSMDDSDLSAELRAFDTPPAEEPVVEAVPISLPAMVFDNPAPVTEPSSFENSPFGRTADQFQPSGVPAAAAPVVEKITAKPAGTRLSDRHVDLPIEVADDERRLHNDARRFARLLVSEIKLYNEKKVQEGRENKDLYERLREAIDRSREMYDKRVQTPVSSKFDYFHYELVNSLAEGDVERLGAKYPGPSS